MFLALWVAAAAASAACTSDPGTPRDDAGGGGADASTDAPRPGPDVEMAPADGGAGGPRGGLYGATVREVVIEVDYQRGAEPYTGPTLTAGDTWDLFRRNAAALFAGVPQRTVTVPTTLAQMQEITDVTAQDFTVDMLLGIASRHRGQASSATRKTFYVVFLEGYYYANGERQRQVLAVSIGDTGVIAMFKPVIRSAAVGSGTMVHRFVEQTTLVHEFGHAAGLVNNGVGLTSMHQDSAHGAHCSNRDCVMYWLNEGVDDMVAFVSRRVTSGSDVLFGEECLADTRAAAAASR